ncbi:hypothetical protein RIF29_34388 [Crotalaria pallida]|uniref:Uncharacterized protein n=1 Tax=Crotalaria pallida TaxID=3830 RepID=A0AAN9EA34_CROPI
MKQDAVDVRADEQAKAVAGGSSGGTDGGNYTNGDIIMGDNQEARIMEKNQLFLRDTPKYEKESNEQISVEKYFGPWMLVKRPLRRKDQIRGNPNPKNIDVPLKMSVGRKPVLASGASRFDALNIEEDVAVNNDEVPKGNVCEDETRVLVSQPPKVVPTIKNKQASHKVEKVRNSTGGKNPQNKGKKLILTKPNNKNNLNPCDTVEKTQPSLVGKSSRAHVDGSCSIKNKGTGSGSEKTILKQKEEEMLRMMSYYQKENKNFCNDMLVHSVLPSHEAVEFVQQRKLSSSNQIQLGEQPDLGKSTSIEVCENLEDTKESSVEDVGISELDMALDTCLQPSSGNQPLPNV